MDGADAARAEVGKIFLAIPAEHLSGHVYFQRLRNVVADHLNYTGGHPLILCQRVHSNRAFRRFLLHASDAWLARRALVRARRVDRVGVAVSAIGGLDWLAGAGSLIAAMRSLLVEAGHVAARHDQKLSLVYSRLPGRRVDATANVAVARRLQNQIPLYLIKPPQVIDITYE